MYRNKIKWRIRLTLSDDPRSHALFHEALADQPVSLVRLAARGTGKAEMTGEVLVELAQDESLGIMLGALHNASSGQASEPAHGLAADHTAAAAEAITWIPSRHHTRRRQRCQ